MNCDILIRGCAVLTEAGEVEEDRSVAIIGGRISAVVPAARDGELAAETVIDGRGKLAMPGLVDGHTHVCQQMLRGRVADEYPMVWTRILVPFETGLTPADVRASAELCCLEMIRAGITSFADAGGVYMDQVAEVVVESGMRAALCRSTMDMGAGIPDAMKESIPDHMRHTEELHRAYHGAGGGRVDIWFGLRQVMTCSPDLIRESADRARALGTGLHAHLCEHRDEVSFCLQNYRMRPADLLEDCGALGPNLLTAHNVVLSEGDITLLAERRVKLIHCPQANLQNHGFPKTPRLLEAGLSLGVGNDGAAGVALDLFDQLRILKNATIAYWGLPVFDPVVLPTAALLRMATVGGAEALGHGDSLGRIAPGMAADVILLDMWQPHLYPTQRAANTVVACATGRDVTHSIIAGKLVMRDREVLTLDEEKILKTGAAQMRGIVSRAGI